MASVSTMDYDAWMAKRIDLGDRDNGGLIPFSESLLGNADELAKRKSVGYRDHVG